MDKNMVDELKKLLLLLIIIAAIVKAVFYKESVITTARTAIALFWMFTLPGYFMLDYWKDKLGFAERAVIGTVAGAAVFAIFSYYLGLAGVNVKYHAILLPVLMIAVAIAIIKMKNRNKNG